MNDHHNQLHEIPAYVAGRLDSNAHRDFEVHLASCGECQDLVSFCETLAEGVRAGDAEVEPHPEPAALESHARNPQAPGGATLVRHLESCLSCAFEVSVYRQGHTSGLEAGYPESVASWFAFRPLSTGVFLGAAAALLAVVVWWPGTAPPVGSWNRSPELLLLEEPVRGTVTVKSIRVEDGQPAIPIAVAFTLTSTASDEDRFLFTIQEEDGSASWELELSASEIRDRLKQGVVLFLVPASSHPPGRYVFSLRPAEAGAERLLRIPFEIVS